MIFFITVIIIIVYFMSEYEWTIVNGPKKLINGSYSLKNTKTGQNINISLRGKDTAESFIIGACFETYLGNTYVKKNLEMGIDMCMEGRCGENSDCPGCNTQSRTCLAPTVCMLCNEQCVDTWADMGKLDHICTDVGRAAITTNGNQIIRVVQKVKCVRSNGMKCNIYLPVNRCLTCGQIGPYLTSENIGIKIDDSENISPINFRIVQKCITKHYFLKINKNKNPKVTTSDGPSIEDIMRKTSESKSIKKKKTTKEKKKSTKAKKHETSMTEYAEEQQFMKLVVSRAALSSE